MTVTYRTFVLHLPPTPLGLLPERWAIEHRCSRCRQRVAPEQLIAHAQDHERNDRHDGESFQSPPPSATLATKPPTNEGGE